MNSTPDAICAEYGDDAKITIRTLEDDGDTILVEADRKGLELLGRLFLAQAASDDCSFQISPYGAGKALFNSNSTKGLYIHRLHLAANTQDKE